MNSIINRYFSFRTIYGQHLPYQKSEQALPQWKQLLVPQDEQRRHGVTAFTRRTRGPRALTP
jgi:hypothetical protein